MQLRDVPGITGRVNVALYGWTPPMVEVVWDGALSGRGVVAVALLERVTFNVATQEWEASQAR